MKRMSWMLGAVVVGVAALTGCSSESKPASSPSRLTVQGSVSSRLGTDNARAVAIGADGKKVWSYLDKNGDFTLKLPVGKSYRVLIANQLPGGGQKVIGKLSLKNGAAKTAWIGAKESGKVNLGKLTKPSAPAASTVSPKCFCDEDTKGTGKDEGGWDDEGEDFGDKGAGYGDKGGWDDGEWGGGGWDDEGDFDDEKPGADKGGKEGWEDDDSANHDDDNECFGDEEDFGDKGDEVEGKGKDKGGFDEKDLCDVCTDGGFIELEPSKKDAGDWGDLDAKESDLPEAKGCTKKAESAPEKKVDTKVGLAKPEEIQSKKNVGDKCSVKNECGTSVCIAAKCVAK